MGERSLTLDIFKGIAIIGFVFVHTVWIAINPNASAFPVPDGCSTVGSVMSSVMFSALLMCFFVSGYLYNPNRTPEENIRRRMKQLLIPFLVLTLVLPVIVFCVMTLAGKGPDLDQLMQLIGSSYISQFFCADYLGYDLLIGNQFFAVLRPYYFFLVLIFGFILFYYIVKCCTKDWKILSLSVVALLFVSGMFFQFELRLPFYLEMMPLAVAFMLVGAFFKKFDFIGYIDNNWKSKNFLVMLVSFLVAGIVIFWFAPAGTLYQFQLGNHGVFSAYTYFAGMLVSGLFIIMMSSLIAKIAYLGKSLSFIGLYIFEIFMFHMFYVKLIASFFLPVSKQLQPEILFDSVPQAAVIMVAAIALSILTAMAIKKVSAMIKDKRTGQTTTVS